MKRRLVFLAAAWFFSASTLGAQDFYKVGIGASMPVGETAGRAGPGVSFVAGVRPYIRSRLYLVLDFSVQEMTARVARPADGSPVDVGLQVLSLTLSPSFDVARFEGFSGYIIGGYGLYNRRLQSARRDAGLDGACDSWWDVCGAEAASETRFVQQSTYKGGFNVGGGAAFGRHGNFFAEVRYHRMWTTSRPTEIIPATFGFRW